MGFRLPNYKKFSGVTPRQNGAAKGLATMVNKFIDTKK